MPLNILLSFLPWVLFSSLFGATNKEILISLVISSAVFIKTDWHYLRKGFVLSWGTSCFLIFIFLFTIVQHNTWVINHIWLLSNSALALIAWSSLLIGKPFTLQYAREQVPKQFWRKPGFIKVNNILTAVWGTIFLFSAILHIFPFNHTTYEKIIYQFLIYGSTALGIWFTQKFPGWYRQHQQKLRNKNNPYLQANYAPIRTEDNFKDLPIEGKIPPDMNGAYMRNGPNPAFEPISYTYPLDGDGMIHAIYINNYTANYRNRYIKTKGLLLEQRLGRAVYGGVANPISPDPKLLEQNENSEPFKNGAFINIIQHANHYLAMWEGGPAYEIDFDLNTLGEWHPGTAKPLSVGPHTRYDKETGDLFLINYDITPPFLVCHRVNRQGLLIESLTIEKPYSTMMHDFAMTKNYFVFFDCPAVLDAQAAEIGGEVLQWDEDLETRIGIISRTNSQQALWINTNAFFVFHFVNAYEESDTIIVDYVRHNQLRMIPTDQNKSPPKLYRMVIDLNNKTVKEFQLNEYTCEFPTFNRHYDTQKYQFIYAPVKLRSNNAFDALTKHDLLNNTVTIHEFGENFEIGEASFAPRISAQAEDDGYLMLFAYNKTTNTSDFIILDAQQMANNPLARIKLPRRVPHGLHGSWMPLNYA